MLFFFLMAEPNITLNLKTVANWLAIVASITLCQQLPQPRLNTKSIYCCRLYVSKKSLSMLFSLLLMPFQSCIFLLVHLYINTFQGRKLQWMWLSSKGSSGNMGSEVRETTEGLQLSWLSREETGCFVLIGLCVLITSLLVASFCNAGREVVLGSAWLHLPLRGLLELWREKLLAFKISVWERISHLFPVKATLAPY